MNWVSQLLHTLGDVLVTTSLMRRLDFRGRVLGRWISPQDLQPLEGVGSCGATRKTGPLEDECLDDRVALRPSSPWKRLSNCEPT